MSTTIATPNVTVNFNPTANPPITFSGDIESNVIHFTDAAAVITLTLTSTSAEGPVRFTTHADNNQNAIDWSDGPHVQTAWTREDDTTVIITALNPPGTAQFPFIVYVYYEFNQTIYPSGDPTIENTPVGPDIESAAPTLLKRAA